MGTANKEDILLRQELNPPLATKGSELIYKEFDDNWITIFNQFVALSQSSNVAAYSAAITYQTNEYVMSAGQIWKMINAAPQINITPGTDVAVWIKVYASDLVEDPTGIKRFSVLVLAADVLTMKENDTPVIVVPALGANKIAILIDAAVTVLFDEGSPGGTPYTTSTTIEIAPTTADVIGGETATATIDQILKATVQKTAKAVMNAIAFFAPKDDLPPNTALHAFTTGIPAAGDSDIIISGIYRELDIS